MSLTEIERIIAENIEENQLTQPKLATAIEQYVIKKRIDESHRYYGWDRTITQAVDERIAELKKGIK